MVGSSRNDLELNFSVIYYIFCKDKGLFSISM